LVPERAPQNRAGTFAPEALAPRVSEERGWGRAGHFALRPLGVGSRCPPGGERRRSAFADLHPGRLLGFPTSPAAASDLQHPAPNQNPDSGPARLAAPPHVRVPGPEGRPSPSPPARPGAATVGLASPGAQGHSGVVPRPGREESEVSGGDRAPQGTYLPGAQPEDGHLDTVVELEVAGHDSHATQTLIHSPAAVALARTFK
jgi:hypothetical protein